MTANELVLALMSSPVVSIETECRVADVMRLSEQHDIHHFPIVTGGKLVGIVCTCDLEGERPDAPALEQARRDVVTVSPNSLASEAARLMMIHAVGSVVVEDEDGVWGILTRDDLVEAAPDLAQLVEEGRCVACETRQHLRAGPDGTFLCIDCRLRAQDGNWFELGDGD